ncbi:MAG: SGNH/GDSL hydrolase family protein [Gemmatimonadaceae bacterium]
MSITASKWVKSLLVVSWAIFWIAIADVAIGILFRERFAITHDERNLTYRYDSELGWFPIPNSRREFKGSRTIRVEHNSRGFRDVEHVVGTDPRIMFLGDSYVWGFDAERSERFTEKLRANLTDWSIYNLGISGYGTDQEFLLLRRHYDFYRPQIVFLVFDGDNDYDDNARNVRYGRYYKPYFTVDGVALRLRGVPVPKLENYFFAQHTLLARSSLVRVAARSYFNATSPPEYIARTSPTNAIIGSMHRFIESKGARFLVGVQRATPQLERFLNDQGIPYVELTNKFTYPSQGRHWTPEGHAFVSQKILEFLDNGNYLKPSSD